MDDLENINKLVRIRFFDKEYIEDDNKIEEYIDDDKNTYYSNLELKYNKFCTAANIKIETSMKTVDEEVIQNKKDFLTAEFTYGEMTFQTLAYCFEYIKNINKLQIKSGYFYDLGSGTGVALLAAALLHPFEKCIGIELMPSLYHISKDLISVYNSVESKYNNTIETHQDNILNFNYDIDKISMIYTGWKCFTKDLKQKIAVKFKSCPEGTLLITLSHSISEFDSSWKVIAEIRRAMSWGSAVLIIHVKVLNEKK